MKMAAMLKKRALAEYSQVIQEEPKPAAKRLRLTHAAPKPQQPPINLKDCGSPSEICSQLIGLEGSLPLNPDVTEAVIGQLKAFYYGDQDEMVKSLIVSLLGKLGKLPGVDSAAICDDLIKWANSEASHKLLSQMLGSLLEIGRSLPQDSGLVNKLVQIAIKNLRDSSHLVRCKCLEMIGCLGSPDQVSEAVSGQSEASQKLQRILGSFTNDNDPRVRCSAFQAMVSWHERGVELERGLYSQACTALTDDYEGVRVCAVHIIWILTQLYPDSMVAAPSGNDDLRLVDDGFAHICNMVNDISMTVRAKAAGMLGSLHNVSPRFLEQTLDKKLMSNMRRKQSAHQRNKEHYEAGEWSTGQKWADDAPKEELEAESVSLMSSGACGAFVHGLEDEYLEVRNAAIDSVCELGTQSPMFAILSQDFLVDMLNDEIDTVRLNAINSLRKISQHIVLREDQLDSVLGVLKDYSYDIREALRDMFCGVTLGTKKCLNTCVLALLDNMRRYPADRDNIWKCVQNMGKNHAFLVMSMAPELLSSHPYLETQEPEVDDPAYIAVLLLVLNATVQCPTMISLFPGHAIRHYNYLRDTLPHLVPELQLCVETSIQKEVSGDSAATHAANFLSDALRRLFAVTTMDAESALQLLDIGIRDVHNVPELDPSLTATARCHEMFLNAHRIILKMLQRLEESTSIGSGSMEDSILNNNIQQVHDTCSELEQCFMGLGSHERLQILQLRLRVHTLQLLLHIQGPGGGSKASCVHFLQILNHIQRSFSTSAIEPDALTKYLLSEIHHLEGFELSTYTPILDKALRLHQSGLLALQGKVQQARGVILEPSGKSETAIKFIAGLTMGVDVIASLENMSNIQDVCIRVRYPDQTVQYTNPRAGDYRQLSTTKHRLITNVIFSHAKWSEPSHIELCLVLRYKRGVSIKTKCENSTTSKHCDFSYIDLGTPVRVLVAPSAEKR